MSLSNSLLAGIFAFYSAPALLALSRGNYGRAAIVFIVPILPLLTEKLLPVWLIWLMFFGLWVPLSVWASKKHEEVSESHTVEKSNIKDKLEMLKWLSIIPVSIAILIGLIIVLKRI